MGLETDVPLVWSEAVGTTARTGEVVEVQPAGARCAGVYTGSETVGAGGVAGETLPGGGVGIGGVGADVPAVS
jgi:hypothetical protein